MRTFLAAVMTIAWGTGTPSPEPARPAMTKIVGRVQRADYEGDRKALASLAGELAPYTQESVLASRALYWRGFALWRRAFNGFNDNVEPRELEKDLTDAVSDFADAAAKDPAFVDARIGSASCLFTLAFLMKSDAERSRAYVTQGVQQMNEVKKVARENPRFLWVQGGGEFILPPERGGGQGKAIETYERALATARKLKGGVQDPLEPSWGEPELLMSLAWSHLNRATPDLQAAESNAREALSLVPYWHYMRDILLPQIREKARLAGRSSTTTRSPASRPTSGAPGPLRGRRTAACSMTNSDCSAPPVKRFFSARRTGPSITSDRNGTCVTSGWSFPAPREPRDMSRNGPS
jgi:hypothetical protein